VFLLTKPISIFDLRKGLDAALKRIELLERKIQQLKKGK